MAVGAVGQAVQKLAFVVGPAHLDDGAGKHVARRGHDLGLVGRAAEDGTGKPLPEARQVVAQHEGAHGVAEHEIGHLGRHLLAHEQAQRLHIGHERVTAVHRVHAATMGRSGSRVAMAHVVVTAHQVAGSGEAAGEVVVAADMLGHAVDELHYAPGTEGAEALPRSLGAILPQGGGQPKHSVHRALPIGGVEREADGVERGRGAISRSTGRNDSGPGYDNCRLAGLADR